MSATQALITGSICRAPEQRTSKTGRPFVTLSLMVGTEGATDYWTVMTFSESLQAELLQLGIGDALSAQGSAKIELFRRDDGEVRISRTLFASGILPLRSPPRARERKQKKPEADTPLLDTPAALAAGSSFFSDDIPFGPDR